MGRLFGIVLVGNVVVNACVLAWMLNAWRWEKKKKMWGGAGIIMDGRFRGRLVRGWGLLLQANTNRSGRRGGAANGVGTVQYAAVAVPQRRAAESMGGHSRAEAHSLIMHGIDKGETCGLRQDQGKRVVPNTLGILVPPGDIKFILPPI